MDKGGIAEGILSRTMEPAQAAVVIGDLLEAGVARPNRWFWSNVAQTLMAAVWRDVRTQPLFVVGLAARGALVLCALLFFVGEARGWVFHFARAMVSPDRWAEQPREWIWPIMRIVSLLATLYAGRWIALRSFGKDVAVCVAMAIVFPFVDYGFSALLAWDSAVFAHQGFQPPPFGRFWLYWREIGSMAAFLVGVALVRRHRRIPVAG